MEFDVHDMFVKNLLGQRRNEGIDFPTTEYEDDYYRDTRKSKDIKIDRYLKSVIDSNGIHYF